MGIDLLELLTMEDLDDSARALAETMGLEAFKTLVRREGGWRISVPSEERVTSGLRRRLIEKEYNGYNIRRLGKKYGLSESAVQKIVRDLRQAQQKKQTSLWDA